MRNYNQEDAYAMAQALSISPITATVLLARGIQGIEEARDWLSPSLTFMHDPFLFPDMDRTVDRLHRAVVRGESICCYGDYDVDGISAVSLYLMFFRSLGANIRVYIPDRQSEGYGLNESAVRKLAQEGVKVLITVDCGTTSHQEVRLARSMGMDVLITDHHQIRGEYPEVHAFLNPHRPDCHYPFTWLCSGGLAYKVITTYSSTFEQCGSDVSSFSDLVALATIADAVPLLDENRELVRDGLLRMTNSVRCGIQALKQLVGVEQVCTENIVAFQLAPMINAAGRLDHALSGVELLTTQSNPKARSLAEHLGRLNRQRREIEQVIFEEALNLMEDRELDTAVVVGARRWHVGVVGIVASRLVERYHRPAVVVAFDEDGVGRGSVRSVSGIDVCGILEQCSDLLEGFGGHPAAAGLKVRETQFPEFSERFCNLVANERNGNICKLILDVDAQVTLQQVHPRLLRELDQLHPFGMGNPAPTFMSLGLRVLEQRVVGSDHLKLVVRQDGSSPFEGIGFRMGSLLKEDMVRDQPIDLVFVPEIQRWKGLDRIQLRIRDLRVSETRGYS